MDEKSPTRGSIIAASVVFASLALSGVGLLAVITFGGTPWYLPTLAYGAFVFVGWQRFIARIGNNRSSK